jgi:DNA-binding NarL/FixJ family response regulator
MVQVFLVDDHPMIRQSLTALLAYEGDLVVCGEAATAEMALEQIGRKLPDLVLIDVSLPGMNGIELARTLRERHPNLPLAMLSGHDEQGHVHQALEAGANGYIVKGNADELPVAIRQIMRGEWYLSPEINGPGWGAR